MDLDTLHIRLRSSFSVGISNTKQETLTIQLVRQLENGLIIFLKIFLKNKKGGVMSPPHKT